MLPTFQPLHQRRQLKSSTCDVLTQLFQSDVNLVIWQRDLTQNIRSYVDTLTAFSDLQLIAEPAELVAVLYQRLPEAEGKAEFIADLEMLSQMLTCLMDCSAVGVRLKRLEKAMCPRFHTDHIASRLIVTYKGPGTEWQIQPPHQSDQPHQVIRTGDVALLKGSGWNGNKDGAIWHRSPHTHQSRLLLSLDPVGE